MPVNLSIKNAPDRVVQRLRERAERHHRSLQGELLAIIEAAVQDERHDFVDADLEHLGDLGRGEHARGGPRCLGHEAIMFRPRTNPRRPRRAVDNRRGAACTWSTMGR